MSIEASVEHADIESNDEKISWVSEHEAIELFAPASDLVGLYLNQVGKIALLSAAEEVSLAKDIEVGLYAQNLLEQELYDSEQEFNDLGDLRQQGKFSMERLVEANLRLVVPIATRYRGKGVPFLDLIQEGSLGLMLAMQKFDYAKGYKFSTFATFKITERIIRSFFTQGYNNPVDRKTGEKLSKLSNLTRRLQEEKGHPPNKEDLAAAMNLTDQEIVELLFLGHDAISLDMAIGHDDDRLGAVLEDIDGQNPVDTLIEWSMRKEVSDLLAKLERDKLTIVRGRFGFDYDKIIPHQTLSRKLKIPFKRVKELEGEILDELRSDDHTEKLREYLY